MVKVNSVILNLNFKNFDVVLFANEKKRAIFLDGRFYFADDWCFTTQNMLANTTVYTVKKIFRVLSYNGNALRFLHSKNKDTHNMEIIYKNHGQCPCCGSSLVK